MTESTYTQKEITRGYAIDIKRVVLAYLVETIIVVTSLVAAWYFTREYGFDNTNTMVMMMLAPIAYAVVEFCRVPLAIAVCKPSHSLFIRIIITFGILGAALVTIKSMSQLGEMMFRPRLSAVTQARSALADAQSGMDNRIKQIHAADALVVQRKEAARLADQQVQAATTELGRLPKQDCSPTSGVGRSGHAWRSMRCVADPRIAPLTATITTASANQKEANARLDEANGQRNQIDQTALDQTLRDQTLAYREAVRKSQLHSFTGMVFGKDPTAVTESEIYVFLCIFVFVPAVGAAFSATIVALTAVHKIKPSSIEISEQAGEYILNPLAESIIREATERHIAAVDAAMPRPPLHSVAAE